MELDTLIDKLSNIREKTPMLLLEKASTIFRNNYRGEIYSIEGVDAARELVEKFYGLPIDKLIVISLDNITYTNKTLSIMLKFIEDSIYNNLVFLSSEDIISSTFMSRIKYIVKIPFNKGANNKLLSASEAQSYYNTIRKHGNRDRSIDMIFAEESSDLYHYYYITQKYILKSKYISLLGV